jgi:hypothetical protein
MAIFGEHLDLGEAIFGVARGNRNAAARRRDDPAVD